MDRRFRHISWALIALIALTSVGMGHARAIMPGVITMVICSGDDVTRQALDARGQPVETAPHCPECLGVDLATTAAAAPVLGGVRPDERITSLRDTRCTNGGHWMSPPVRAPPVV